MSKYNTTEAIREAIHALEEGDIIKVPQYTNALEVEHLGELNGEKNAYVGVRFADPSKRTSAVKNIILNKHSGIAYLSAGTTSKGIVSELEIPLKKSEPEEDEEPEPAMDEDAFGHSEKIEVERPVGTLVTEEDDDEAEAPGKFEPEIDEAHHILGDRSGLADIDPEVIDAKVSGRSPPREIEERELTFEEEYREEVAHIAAVIIDEIEADMGEDFEHVTRSDLPEVADREVGEELYFHEYTTESENYPKVIEASPSDPDACTWQDYVNFEERPDADDVFGAMAYVLFREDLRSALRGEW